LKVESPANPVARAERTHTRHMREIATHIDIDAGASLVWSVLTRFAEYRRWIPLIGVCLVLRATATRSCSSSDAARSAQGARRRSSARSRTSASHTNCIGAAAACVNRGSRRSGVFAWRVARPVASASSKRSLRRHRTAAPPAPVAAHAGVRFRGDERAQGPCGTNRSQLRVDACAALRHAPGAGICWAGGCHLGPPRGRRRVTTVLLVFKPRRLLSGGVQTRLPVDRRLHVRKKFLPDPPGNDGSTEIRFRALGRWSPST
jgi:hypothetical protein